MYKKEKTKTMKERKKRHTQTKKHHAEKKDHEIMYTKGGDISSKTSLIPMTWASLALGDDLPTGFLLFFFDFLLFVVLELPQAAELQTSEHSETRNTN